MLNMCIPIPSPLAPDPIRPSETLISGSCNDSVMYSSSGEGSPVAAPDRRSLAISESDSESEGKEEQLELKQEGSFGGGEYIPDECGLETVDEAKKIVGEVDETGGCGNEVIAYGSEASPSFSPIRSRSVRKPVAPQARCETFSSYFNDLGFDSSTDFDEGYSGTGLHLHASFSQPITPSPPPPVGAGLANMGNTCFLNAVMQCFTHTVPLVLGLRSLYDDGVPRHHNDGEFCVLSAVRDHVFHALAASGEVIFPCNLVSNLSYISSVFKGFQQEDAHEYLQCLLDKTDTCWWKCRGEGKGVSSQGYSLVKQVFGGRLVSQLHCCNCGSRSDTYEPLVDLSLEIEDVDDLNGALQSFTKMEENEDEVKFTCENCKEQVPLKKQLLIDQAPAVATLHLKRFKGDGYFVEKIDKVLEYPLELDLKPYTVNTEDENVDLKYELYAVIEHIGCSSASGHYLCYIRSSPDRWFQIDDSKVTEVREDVALSQQGYILFYARKGTPWPCTLVRSLCDNGVWNTSPKSVLDNVEHTQCSNPRKMASLYSKSAIETSVVVEASTDLQLPFQQTFDEACIGLSRNTEGVSSSEPSTMPKYEVCNEELFAGNSSLSGVPKDNEAQTVGIVHAECPTLNNDSSKKSSGGILFYEDFVDGDPSSGPTSTMPKLSSPAPPDSIEHESNGFRGSANITKPSKSRSPSPDIYSESEDQPEASYPQPLKKTKVENCATVRKPSMTPIIQDRKRKEALRSIRRIPHGRRHLLMAALAGLPNEGSMSKNRRRH